MKFRLAWRDRRRACLHHEPRQYSGQISLVDLSPGQLAQVVALSGGRCMISRMASLGFTPGALVTMIQNYGHGPLIVSVRDTRVALGRHEARAVVVQQGVV